MRNNTDQSANGSSASMRNRRQALSQRVSQYVIATAFALLLALTGQAQERIDGFIAREHGGANGFLMPYRLFVPSAATSDKPLPLIVYLHGSGGWGTDNLKQISGGNAMGTHLWTVAEVQKEHLAFVVAPQIPEDMEWSALERDGLSTAAEAVLGLIDSLSREFAIDEGRVYLVGQSLGGFGVWDVVSKRPQRFAAAIAVCGAGDPSRIVNAKAVPVWAFHGAQDQAVPVQESRKMVAALKAAGGVVRYTEYPDVGHDVWNVAFADPELPRWLFAQRRQFHP